VSEKTPRRAGRPRRKAERVKSAPAAIPSVAKPVPESSPPAERRLLARVPISVRWRDLDAFNHVNNSTFLTYLEEARLSWLSQIRGAWFSETYMPLLANTDVNYRAPINWPGNIVVELYCERLGNASLTLAHRIVDAQQRDLLYSDGKSVMVWVEPASGRSIALPAVIRNACE
jgi:acyl-CoA thioester hydrolase